MEDLRKCWKVPYIVYYCSLLEQTLDLIDLRIDEFEEAIIDDSGNERNIIILHLLQKLLKPFVNRTIDLTNFESLLLGVLRKHNEENLFLNNKESNNWNDLTILNKIDIIHLLCELRLHLNDIEAKFNDIDPNCLRIEPIGVDSIDNKLWYFGDLRLYEEKPVKKEKKLTQITPNKRTSKSNRRSNKRNKTENEEDEYFLLNIKNEIVDWNCVCVTLDDWYEFTSKFKKSRKKHDQELYQILEENYLNEMPALFNKAEKERQQRLLALAPKRTSQRLEMKRQTTQPFSYTEINESEPKEIENDPTANDKLKKEELSKQREERLKLRELKKDLNNNSDESSQLSSISDLSNLHSNSSDFNGRNYLLMKKILNKILSSKYAWPFKSAVTEIDAPDYKTIVEQPIDLSIIQRKINNKLYKSRNLFCEDLQLIVSNCCLYNGVDSFYGKIALKFESFYKRWLQIIYPREISNSFEEKNRLLLKLNSSTSTSAAVAAATNEEENNTSIEDENKINIASETLLPLNNENNKNIDNNNIENEQEYITKRTSFGRLVKMKVRADYDYESDQDENSNKKRKNKYYSDEEFISNNNKKKFDDNNKSDISDASFEANQYKRKNRRKKYNSDDDDDEVGLNDNSIDKEDNESTDDDYNSNDSMNEYKKTTQKRRGRPKRKSRIDELMNSGDENTSSTNDGNCNSSIKTNKKLTFDQYVKILTGSPNGNGITTTTSLSSCTTNTSTNVLSQTANASKLIKNINIDKLKVPIINPLVTAVLEANKLKQQQNEDLNKTPTQIQENNNDCDISPPNMLNVDNLTKSIKIIAMPTLSNGNIINSNANLNNKKLIILNGNCTQSSSSIPTTLANSQPSVLTNSNVNLIKIVNLSQPVNTISTSSTTAIATPIKVITPTTVIKNTTIPVITSINKNTSTPNRQIIVINNSTKNQQNVNKTQISSSPVQILTKITNNTIPTQLAKTTTNQNSQPNIETITKIAPTTIVNSQTTTISTTTPTV